MAEGAMSVSERQWAFKESIDTDEVRQIVSAQFPAYSKENNGYIKDGNDVFVAFAKFCAGLTQVIRGVKSLKMDKWSFADSGLLALVAILEAGHFNDLHELAIYGFSTYDFPVAGQKFCNLLQSGRLYNLRSLDVSGSGFGRKGMEMLMKSLQSNHASGKLEALHVVFGEVGNRQVEVLVGTLALGHLRNLQTLDLTCNKLQAGGVESLAVSLLSGLLKSLKSLNLPDNAIGDAGVQSLAASFESGNLSELETLDLSSNQVGDVGVVALARSFRSGKCGNLRHLDLSRNQFGGKGLVALAEVFESGCLSELETVDLTFIRANLTGPGDDSSHGIIQTASALRTGSLASVKDLLLFDSWADIDGLLPTVKQALLECYRKNPYLIARICLEHEAYAKTRDTENLNTLRWRNEKRVARLEKWQNEDQEEVSGLGNHGKVFFRGNRGAGTATPRATWMKESLISRTSTACTNGRWIPFFGNRKRQRESKKLASY